MSLTLEPMGVDLLPLRFVNSYLIRGKKNVLVDTGFAGQSDVLLKKIEASGTLLSRISLIVITHTHPDHAGNAVQLRNRLGVPVAIHRADADWLSSGQSVIPRPIRPFGYYIKATVKTTLEPCVPDILLEDGMSLEEYGVAGRIIHTPGHSPGSISIAQEGGDLLVGDLMAGSEFKAEQPDYHYLAEDKRLVEESILKLLNLRVNRVYFGHGKPARYHEVQKRFAGLKGKAGPVRSR